jgi:mono/diheme cytochrome c family protein
MNRRWHLLFVITGMMIALISPGANAQVDSSPLLPSKLPHNLALPHQGGPAQLSINSILKWDAETKEVTVTNGTIDTHFAFWLTNVSTDEIVINGVHTSCGCTAAQLPEQPWKLAPGTNGEIRVTMNVAGKVGLLTKTVTINTDEGPKILFVKANILPPAAGQMTAIDREANQKLALADRQAVFQGDCARCHAEVGPKMGKELYASVCGVCHEAEHRASMVPNLHALSQPTNAEYWRNWITKGKPGTLMPAFSEKEEGILSDDQIDSIVKYLTETIPSKATGQPNPPPTGISFFQTE